MVSAEVNHQYSNTLLRYKDRSGFKEKQKTARHYHYRVLEDIQEFCRLLAWMIGYNQTICHSKWRALIRRALID